jgi:hypothetical protein
VATASEGSPARLFLCGLNAQTSTISNRPSVAPSRRRLVQAGQNLFEPQLSFDSTDSR